MSVQTVLITGASRGIGKSTALAFASHGFRVFLNCRSSLDDLDMVRRQIEDLYHVECYLVPGDVGNPDAVRQIFQKIRGICGGVDVLINNAGISHVGLLRDLTDARWEEILSSNLSSVFYCCREAIPYMVSRQSGRIINVSSMWGRVRRILRSRILCFQSRCGRAYKSSGKGTGSQLHTGQRGISRRHRHIHEYHLFRRGTPGSERRDPHGTVRNTGRNSQPHLSGGLRAFVPDRTGHPNGRRFSVKIRHKLRHHMQHKEEAYP